MQRYANMFFSHLLAMCCRVRALQPHWAIARCERDSMYANATAIEWKSILDMVAPRIYVVIVVTTSMEYHLGCIVCSWNVSCPLSRCKTVPERLC